MGKSQRPGEKEQVQEPEPEPAGTDLSFTQDVLSAALHVSSTTSGTPANGGEAEFPLDKNTNCVNTHSTEQVNVPHPAKCVYDGQEC